MEVKLGLVGGTANLAVAFDRVEDLCEALAQTRMRSQRLREMAGGLFPNGDARRVAMRGCRAKPMATGFLSRRACTHSARIGCNAIRDRPNGRIGAMADLSPNAARQS